jgi:protein arginine kinase
MKDNNNKKRDAGPSLRLESPPWADINNEIWLASTLELHRNVDKYLFPIRLEASRRGQLLKLIEQSIVKLPQLTQPRFLPAEELQPTDKELLAEHFLVATNLQQAHIGEGFIVDQTGRFLAICNMRDHLALLHLDWKGELEDQWNHLAALETDVGKSMAYAFSNRFGFLTSDPFQCGTGLIIHCYLHLPALIHTGQLQEVLQVQEEISCTSLLGEGEGFVGDLVVIRNSATIGTTEESIVAALRQATTRLMAAEKSARSTLADKKEVALRDKVGRAFGILANSLQLQAAEALDQLSLLKLGVHLGWITGITPALCNQLYFLTRRGHLSAHLQRALEPEEVPQQRATLLRDLLRSAQVAI